MQIHTCTDDVIAAALNRNGLRTGRGNRFTRERVASLRNYQSIPCFSAERARAEGWTNLTGAAAILGISPRTLRLAIFVHACCPIEDVIRQFPTNRSDQPFDEQMGQGDVRDSFQLGNFKDPQVGAPLSELKQRIVIAPQVEGQGILAGDDPATIRSIGRRVGARLRDRFSRRARSRTIRRAYLGDNIWQGLDSSTFNAMN
jgi:hypothetical protein